MFEPWETHPALTPDRLIAIARLIQGKRHEVALLYEPERGDDPWTLGCRGYEWSCFAIREAAKTWDWLAVIEPGRHFVFAIGGVPLRFYRGEPDHVRPASLVRNYPEIAAQQLAFSFPGLAPTDRFFRLAVETDAAGEVARTSLVMVDDAGDPVDHWVIPLDEVVVPLYREEKSIDVGPPPVRVRRDAERGREGA